MIVNMGIIEKYFNDIIYFKTKFSLAVNKKKSEYCNIACSYFNTILTYLVNLSELTNQFSRIQQEKMYMSSVVISRSIFEECAILNQLFKQSKYGENSYFYKYLYIKDMSQDISINKRWNIESNDYWRRIHNLLQQHFDSEVDLDDVQPFSENIEDFRGYTEFEIKTLNKCVSQLEKQKCYQYTKSQICADLFNDVYSNTDLIKLDVKNEAKNDIKVIYGQLCHYSHLNITAIDELNVIKTENGSPILCFDQKIKDNNVILQWIKFSLDYIFDLFNKSFDNI